MFTVLSHYRWVMFSLAMLLLFAISYNYLYSFTDVRLKSEGRLERNVSFPFRERTESENRKHVLTATLTIGLLSPREFRIIPDDKMLGISINGQDVDLSAVPKDELSDWERGFVVDLREYLKGGENTISFTYFDYTGQMGVSAYSSLTESRLLFWRLLSLFLLLLSLTILLSSMKFSKLYIVLISAAIVERIAYCAITGFDVRGHDVPEHLEYILHFVNTWALPSLESANGGAYFHPPFYYFIASLFYQLANFISPGNVAFANNFLQYLSVSFSCGFVIYAVKFMILAFGALEERSGKRFLGTAALFGRWRLSVASLCAFWGSALIVFWPSVVMHSSRIGNDPLIYFFMAASLYHTFRYYLYLEKKQFFIALVFACLAMLTKANGVVSIAIGVAAVLTLLLRGRLTLERGFYRQMAAGALILLMAAGATFYPGVKLKLSGDRTHVFIDNMTNIPSSLKTGNRAGNYLWMDVKTFITKPYTSPWVDDYGRQYFANYLLKTGLVGEWWFEGALAENTSIIISFILLLLIMASWVGLYRMPVGDFTVLAPMVAALALFFMSIYYVRMTFPANIDFRYITPVVILMSLFFNYASWVFSAAGVKRMTVILLALQVGFVISSLLFISHLFFL